MAQEDKRSNWES